MAAAFGMDSGPVSLAGLVSAKRPNEANDGAQAPRGFWRRIEFAEGALQALLVPAHPSLLCIAGNATVFAQFRAMVRDGPAARICGMDEACRLLERMPSPQVARTVLMVDIELCAGLDTEAWQRLCGRQPGPRLLMVWPAPARRWVPTILATRASGCVDWAIGAVDLCRAVAAVQSGELWLPRQFMGWVFAALLADSRPHPTVAVEPDGAGLTPREAEVLKWLRQGLSNKQIAARMGISVNTVKKHVAHAFEKRGVVTRRQERY